jgi:hypothetical protein
MFTEDFYPTPRPVAAAMLATISPDARNILEPSAGKGDLAEVLRGTTAWGQFPRKVDCIESDPELVPILKDKGFPVVGFDWLTYPGVSYYDAIVMNPPFSTGAAHLLKAWDFMHNGEIVCLLNQETIDNPYTTERRRLAQVIAEHGRVEPLGQCFTTAARKTDVSVALVYLKRVAEDDMPEVWATDKPERDIDGSIDSEDAMLAVQDELGNLEHYYRMAGEHMFKAFAHLRKAQEFMKANGLDAEAYKEIAAMGFSNLNAARAEFSRKHRRDSWMKALGRLHFQKWLDQKQTEALLRDVESNSDIPFTADNVKATLENVMLQRHKLFEKSVANVFDALTGWHKANTSISGGGWKTNDEYKVNAKLIFPYGCRWEPFFGFTRAYYRDLSIYDDLDRVVAVLDGRKFEEITRVGQAMDAAFRVRKTAEPGGNRFETTFFEGRFFQKGTVHLKWKSPELLAKFNIKAAAGKRWIGRQTQEAA